MPFDLETATVQLQQEVAALTDILRQLVKVAYEHLPPDAHVSLEGRLNELAATPDDKGHNPRTKTLAASLLDDFTPGP